MSVIKLENFIKNKKKIYIAIDLDNTIINYDDCFKYYLSKYKLNFNDLYPIKNQLKKNVNHEKWKKIQGEVYGKLILRKAKLNYGFLKYLNKIDKTKFVINLTSHKTINGHGLKKINLRDQANKFLKKNKIYDYFNQVYYFDSFKDKINHINNSNYSIVIDDLDKVLNQISDKLIKIKFTEQNTNSIKNGLNWFGIDQCLNKSNDTIFIKNLLEKKYQTKFYVRKINQGGNSKIYRVFNYKFDYKIKIHNENDSIDKINKEIFFNNLLYKKKFNVNKIIKFDPNYFLSLSKWIKGKKINYLNNKNIFYFINFVSKLKKININFDDNLLASASCFDLEDVKKHFNERVDAFNEIKPQHPKVYEFIIKKIQKNFLNYYLYLKQNKNIDKFFNSNIYFLSPSDFGIHNSIKKKSDIYFFDFEYAGFDSSMKLICDFIYNPSNKIYSNKKIQNLWVKESSQIFDIYDDQIINLVKPLFGFIWCLIVLNEYKTNKWERRVLANNKLRKNLIAIQKNKLVFSKKLYDIVIEDIEHAKK